MILIYENPIWIPIMDCDTFLPKTMGIRYVIFGKSGPLPKPTRNNPA